MDRDSYDSTDWFNALDWTYNDNGWGHGLPLKDKNGSQWTLMQPRLANPEIAPSQAEMQQTLEMFQQWLRIRRSSPLFRLQTAEQIQAMVHFHNTGPQQEPGLIVMSITDDPQARLDPNYDLIVVLWNAAPEEINWQMEAMDLGELTLHPLLTDAHNAQAAYDPATQTFTLPGRSTAVFVRSTPLEEPPTPEVSATDTPTTAEPDSTHPDRESPSGAGLAITLGAAAIAAIIFGGWWVAKEKK
ncbi:MAG TPA: DUF3372 domain-containing protein [Anaerolineales bacterium]|nr:DUF3372 domain-containing protein [Anaerolineales bacterium]